MVNFMDFKSIQRLLLMNYQCKPNKLDVHECLIVMYFYFKFHKIRLWGYLVIANYIEF